MHQAQIRQQGQSLQNSILYYIYLILGIAYKADVDDDRESPSYVLMDLLAKHGACVSYYDPHIPVIRPSREHLHWAGTRSIPWTSDALRKFEVVLISTRSR
jgi:UDP-N-acetyl-D-glucosamine dehydrogenase